MIYPPEKDPQGPSSDQPSGSGPVPQYDAPHLDHLQNIVGQYEGFSYKVGHRDSNTVLYCTLQPGYEVLAKPGAVMAMAPEVQIQGKFNFSWKKFLSGGEITFSHLRGPGEVIIAPETWGDIAAIRLDGQSTWHFGKHAFLASGGQITMNTKAQSVGKALFAGPGLFVGTAVGVGMLFVQSHGAIIIRDLQPGEQWIVNDGHLVAWNCKYNIELIKATGGLMSAIKTDEGAVCRFTGPGRVYTQSRNPEQLIKWIAERVATS